MRLSRRSSPASRQGLARTYRWVTAWLIAGAVLALLLLANSIRDYLFVWRILAVQQVRQELSQQMVALEQKLRRPATPGRRRSSCWRTRWTSAPDKPLWIEIRRPDGSVLARRGSAGARQFSNEDESAHFRNRQALYGVVPASGRRGRGGGLSGLLVRPGRPSPCGAPGIGRLDPAALAGGRGDRGAARRSGRIRRLADPPEPRDQLQRCVGSARDRRDRGPRLPLLRARPAPRAAAGDRAPGAVRAAAVSDAVLRARPAGDRLPARRAGERRFLRRVPRPATAASRS